MSQTNRLKSQLLKKCQDWLQLKFGTIQSNIEDVQNALASETKSTAGDKHETGRAMLQLEREKLGQQLIEFEQLKEVLNRIDVAVKNQNVHIGSVVFTNQFNYFIAISCGELILEDIKFYSVSAATPIAQSLLGKSEGDVIEFRGANISVLKIL